MVGGCKPAKCGESRLAEEPVSMSEHTERAPSRAINAPNVVLVLIGLFVAVHLYRFSLPVAADTEFLLKFAFIPARYDPPAGLDPRWLVGGAGAEYWTVVTHAFLHADWVHLAINSFWMLAFGSVLARRLGALRFLVISALCAIAGVGLYAAMNWQEFAILIGASGAISGQTAAALRLIFSRPSNLFQASRMRPEHMRASSLSEVLRNPQALVFVGVWMAVNVFFGLNSDLMPGVEAGGIAWEAHLGGFLAGLLLFGLFDRKFAKTS